MSMIENKAKITVNVTGDTNKERPIYYILESQIYHENSTCISKLSPDVIDYVLDKYSLLASLPIDKCLETGSEDLILSNMMSYVNYRALKFEFINELYSSFNVNSINYIFQLIQKFLQEISLEAEYV
ncbi:hypothetical protein P4S56_16900 [Pseudoalteromonas sp. Hal056]